MRCLIELSKPNDVAPFFRSTFWAHSRDEIGTLFLSHYNRSCCNRHKEPVQDISELSSQYQITVEIS